MTPTTPENIEQMVEQVRKFIAGYHKETDPGFKINALDNFLWYLKTKLDDGYNDFLDFAFPAYAGMVLPLGLLICTDNLPELLRNFLKQS
jgi:hypothetical protein